MPWMCTFTIFYQKFLNIYFGRMGNTIPANELP